MKTKGKIRPPVQNTEGKSELLDMPKANYNPRKVNKAKFYERCGEIIAKLRSIYSPRGSVASDLLDELENIDSPRGSVAYDLLDELETLLFTLVDECARVPEIIIDGCSNGEENEYERTESVFGF